MAKQGIDDRDISSTAGYIFGKNYVSSHVNNSSKASLKEKLHIMVTDYRTVYTHLPDRFKFLPRVSRNSISFNSPSQLKVFSVKGIGMYLILILHDSREKDGNINEVVLKEVPTAIAIQKLSNDFIPLTYCQVIREQLLDFNKGRTAYFNNYGFGGGGGLTHEDLGKWCFLYLPKPLGNYNLTTAVNRTLPLNYR